MSRPQNRTQLMDRVGAVQLNTMWSWCGVNEEKRRAYFSIWKDKLVKGGAVGTYIVQEPHWGMSEDGGKSPARNDHDNKLALVFDKGYQPWGYFIEAKDPTAIPRQIENTATSFVVRLELMQREDGVITGRILERVEIS